MKALKKLLNTWTKRIVAIVLVLILLLWVFLFFQARETALGLVVPILVTLLVVGVSWLSIHFGIKAWRKRKRSEFDEAVAAKEGIEDRRREWSTWTEELEKQGIDRYELPFYLLVGEPQSGKSVLLHNSDLHFPFGQNRLSGVGGTRGCDWWFTEEAVILDLAGRLFTHEGGATDRLEFESFLKLLYEFRPLCPANGVILVIPCDSLLQDDGEKCGLKASKIQNALLTVTTQLQAQVPVYLVLTKGDQIFGFAESVHRLDVERRHQMFGWSRPADKVDTPFDLAEVTQGFEELVRRAQLLRAHMGAGARLPEALPEIDRMYAFPHELAGMLPNLEVYLKRIFTASNLIDRVFFRGLYLTSGLQTGVPIAKVCTELFGKAGEADRRDLQALFNKQRAYFIKDLIRSRVFGERGLVRPTQGRVQQTRRSSIVGYGISGALVLASLIFSGTYLMKEVKAQRKDLYEDALDSAGASLVEKKSLNDLLTTVQKISDAQREPVDSAERTYFDPSEEFKPLYGKIFDERVLPEVLQQTLRRIQGQIGRGFRSFEELQLACEAMIPLLGETVDFSDDDVSDAVLALLEEEDFRSRTITEAGGAGLSLAGAFELRHEYGGSKRGMVLAPGPEERGKITACAKGVLAGVEACVEPGALSQPREELGYMLAWYEAEEARGTLLHAEVLTSNKVLPAVYAFARATERMESIEASLPADGAGKALAFKDTLLPLKKLGAGYQQPLAKYVAAAEGGIPSPWPFLNRVLAWAYGKFESVIQGDAGILSALGINFGGTDAQITLFEASEDQLSLLSSKLVLGVDAVPLVQLDDPPPLRSLCKEALPRDTAEYPRLGRRIDAVANGILEGKPENSDIFKVFQAELLEIGDRYQRELPNEEVARQVLLAGQPAPPPGAYSMELVEDLYELHRAVGTLVEERKVFLQKQRHQTWQKHIERLLFDHLSRASVNLEWVPRIPEIGDFQAETWEALRVLGDVADTEKLVEKESSQVNAEASRLQGMLFMSLAEQMLARWDVRPADSVSETQATVDDLKLLANGVNTRIRLAPSSQIDFWGTNVDEVLSGRLQQLQAMAQKVWEPRPLSGSLENAVQTASEDMRLIDTKINASKTTGLMNLGGIVASLSGVSIPGVPLKKTRVAMEELRSWKIPLDPQSIRNTNEYRTVEDLLGRFGRLDLDQRKRGNQLAAIYKQSLLNLPPIEDTEANAGVQMVRKIRRNLAEVVRAEIQRAFLEELRTTLRSSAFEDLFQALFWRPENYAEDVFDYDDKEVARGLNEFFTPGVGEYSRVRHLFLLVGPDGEVDLDTAIFPPGAASDEPWEEFHYFLRDLQQFLTGGKRATVEDVTITFSLEPDTRRDQTVWDNNLDNRAFFHYPGGGPSNALERKRVGADMGKLRVSDWGFRRTSSDRGMSFFWSKYTISTDAVADRDAWFFKTPSCLAPMLLAWAGKPRRSDNLKEYFVEFIPQRTDLAAPMVLHFENDLPVRPRRKP